MKKRYIPLVLICSFILMGFGFSPSSWFNGVPKETLISKLSTGIYKAGNLAVGIDLDLDNQRSIGNGLIPNNPMNDYLNNILGKILASASIQDYPGKVYIRAAMLQWGAETTPDGNIYVNAGTLRNLESEDEVAALLAHEVSHALLKHHDSDVFVNFQKQFQTLGEWASTAKTVINGLESGTAGQIAASDMRKLRNAQYFIMLSSIVISPAWNRGQETDADRLGLDLLVNAGYNSYAMLKLLEKDQNWQINYANDTDPEVISKKIQAIPESTKESGLGLALSDIIKTGIGQLAGKLSQKHPDPETRLKDYREYAQKFYRGKPFPKMRTEPWIKARANPKVAEIWSGYEWAYRAEKLLGSEPSQINNELIKEAVKYADLGRSGAARNHAYPLLVASQVLELKGDRTRALNMLEQAANSPETVGLVYLNLAQFYSKGGDKTKALQAAMSGYKRLNESPSLTPQMIQYHKASGDTQGAMLMTEQCALKSPAYKDKCRESFSDNATYQ